jgi:uncharacterized membrane protein YdjX (TVP38/TMEM64 family)
MIAQTSKPEWNHCCSRQSVGKLEEKNLSRWISIIAGLLVTIAITVLLFVGPKAGSVDNLRQTLLTHGPWTAVAISAGLMIAQAVLAPLPGNVITITNSLVFGPIWGSVLSWFTTVVGASLCFHLARALGKPFAERIVGNSVQKAERFFRTYGLHAMFFVRMMPLVPFDAVSYGAGLVGVPFSRFLLATSLGIIPSILVYSYLGGLIAGVYWWVLITMLTVSLIGIIAAAKVFRKRQPPTDKITTPPNVALGDTAA